MRRRFVELVLPPYRNDLLRGEKSNVSRRRVLSFEKCELVQLRFEFLQARRGDDDARFLMFALGACHERRARRSAGMKLRELECLSARQGDEAVDKLVSA